MTHRVKIIQKKSLNHDVVQFCLQRPEGYTFTAGQAIELTLEKQKKGPAPFTFTGLSSSPNLELTIKIYKERNGLTAALSELGPGDEVVITDPWDSFTNKGPGIFIAGGAGITPFIALLRALHGEGKVGNSYLFFSNKTEDDIFLNQELKGMLGDRYIDIITRGTNPLISNRIDEALLEKHIKNTKQPFYVCGPPGFVDAIQQALAKVGAKNEMVNISL